MGLYQQVGERQGLERLVQGFYASLMQDPRIAPVFEAHLGPWGSPRWEVHLQRIVDFWVMVCGGPRHYQGEAGLAHINKGITAQHFAVWLEHFKHSTHTLLSPNAAHALYQMAQKMQPGMQELAVYGQAALRKRKS